MNEELLEGEIKFGNEKREHPRVLMSVPVRYRVLSHEEATKALNRTFDADTMLQEFAEGETINVSKTGILMYTNEEVPVKSFVVVNMHISIPGISCNCKALAEVMRRELAFASSLYSYKMALKFHKILHHNLKKYKFMNLKNLLDIKEESI